MADEEVGSREDPGPEGPWIVFCSPTPESEVRRNSHTKTGGAGPGRAVTSWIEGGSWAGEPRPPGSLPPAVTHRHLRVIIFSRRDSLHFHGGSSSFRWHVHLGIHAGWDIKSEIESRRFGDNSARHARSQQCGTQDGDACTLATAFTCRASFGRNRSAKSAKWRPCCKTKVHCASHLRRVSVRASLGGSTIISNVAPRRCARIQSLRALIHDPFLS